MNMPTAIAPTTRMHPMLIVASSAVMLVSLTGAAALMGWLPNSHGATAISAEPVAGQPQANAAPAHHLASHAHAEPMRRTQTLVCQNCGTVEAVREVNTPSSGSGLGAAGGAVVGGLLGNQVGGGHGRQAMTVVGAIGGALAGNEIEKQARSLHRYETTVHMNNGTTRTMAQDAPPEWRDGDRVRIVDGVLRMNG